MKKKKTTTYAEAIRDALFEEMRRDKSIFIMGEDIGVLGGRWGATAGLIKEFSEERVIDTPINEELFVGIAMGAAMEGMRPVVELMYGNFLTLAADDLYRAGIWSDISGGKFKMPIVIRMASGGYVGRGPELSSFFLGLAKNFWGINLVCPSTPYDAKGLLKFALRQNEPALFFEHKMLYQKEEKLPETEYVIPFGRAEIRKKGKDLTVIAMSYMVDLALKASEILEKEGIDCEIVDLRTFRPLDIETMVKSIAKTKRVLIVEEDWEEAGVGADLALKILEGEPKAEIRRVCSKNSPIYFGEQEKNVLVQIDDIVGAAKHLLRQETYKKRKFKDFK